MSEYCKEKGIDSITDKIGSAKETVTKLEFLPEWVRKIASTDATAFLPIGNKLDGKNVILVFDDLERCCMNMVDVLGIINDYCENQKYHFYQIVLRYFNRFLNRTKITFLQKLGLRI